MPRSCSISLASLLALAGALAGGDARAADAPRVASLGWVRLPGAESCVGPPELASMVERRLGRAVFVSAAQAGLHVEAHVAPMTPALPPRDARTFDLPPLADTAGFRAHISISDAGGALLGTRELEAPRAGCRALDEQLALVIALLIDPDAALAPRAPSPKPRAPKRVIVERILAPDSTPLPPPAKPWKADLAVGASVSAGLVPKAGIALSLRGEIVPPSFVPIEIGADLTRDAAAFAPGSATKGATLSLAYGTIGVCPLVWEHGATRVRGCLDLGAGSIRSVGSGFSGVNGAGQEQPVIHGAAAGRVSHRLVGPLELGVGLGLLVPFRRARFFYVDAAGDQQELYRMAPVAGLIDATVGLSFP